MESGVIDQEEHTQSLISSDQLKPVRVKLKTSEENLQTKQNNSAATSKNVGSDFKLSTTNPHTTKINASNDSDNAESKLNQTLNFMLPESSTLPVTESYDQYGASYAMQYDQNNLEYYDEPFTSFLQEDHSTMLSPSYNFSGLQVNPLLESPKVWDSQQQFLEQVGLKLYMFVPAVAAGTLLSITFWIIAMMVLRTYGLVKKKIFSISFIEDVEMGSSLQTKQKSSSNSKTVITDSTSARESQQKNESFDNYCEHQDCSHTYCDTKQSKLLKIRTSSHHSSPVSLSSGIGVSEDIGSADERDRESEDRVAEHGCDHRYCYCQCGKRWEKSNSESNQYNSDCERKR